MTNSKNKLMVCHTRRQMVRASGGLFAMTALPQTQANSITSTAMPAELGNRIQNELGSVPLVHQGVHLTMPALSENGNSVALEVMVEQAQTKSGIAKLMLFSEKNPIAKMGDFHFPPPPPSQLIHVSTRVRLADTQTVAAVAQTFDDQFFIGFAEVIVTLAACVDLS